MRYICCRDTDFVIASSISTPSVLIEIDGGVGAQNASALVEAGANVLVAGSSVFKAPNPDEAVKALVQA